MSREMQFTLPHGVVPNTPRAHVSVAGTCAIRLHHSYFSPCVLCSVLLTNELRVFTTQGVRFKAALFGCLCRWARKRARTQDGLPSSRFFSNFLWLSKWCRKWLPLKYIMQSSVVGQFQTAADLFMFGSALH